MSPLLRLRTPGFNRNPGTVRESLVLLPPRSTASIRSPRMAYKLCSAPLRQSRGKPPIKKTVIDILETTAAQTLEVRKRRGAERKKSVTYLAHSFAEPFQSPYSCIPYIRSQNMNDPQTICPVCLCFPWLIRCFHDSLVSQYHPMTSHQIRSGPIPIPSSKKESHGSQQS